jgi:hypothetical protein
MKLRLFALAALALSSAAIGQVHVRGYTTKRGTYVAPYWRSSPDHNTLNNWSTVGNVNPYTGVEGTRNPYPSVQPPPTYIHPYKLPELPDFSKQVNDDSPPH